LQLDAPNASADDAAPQTQHEGKHEGGCQLAGKGEYKAAERTFAQERRRKKIKVRKVHKRRKRFER